MSNETKQDVFEKALNEWDDLVHRCGLQGEESHGGCEFDKILIKYKKDYNAALPDDLPIIPKVVSEYIQWGKSYDIQLYMMYNFKFIHSQGFKKLTDDVESWIISSSDTFARAWLDGYEVEVSEP